MTQRVLIALALLLAAMSAANGLFMIIDPIGWYHAVPGVIETGPPNTHFITDIGCAYLASAVLLVAAVLRPQSRGVLTLAAALWPTMHAVVHIVGLFTGHGSAVSATEMVGIYLPVAAQIALGIYWLTERRDPTTIAALHARQASRA